VCRLSLIDGRPDDFERFGADIIAEVSHPSISVKYGPRFVRAANFFVGSPTAFADTAYETFVRPPSFPLPRLMSSV
jgi:hypothetical protein